MSCTGTTRRARRTPPTVTRSSTAGTPTRPTESAGARFLVVANTDGSDPALLLPAGQRQAGDVDLDPAWSPDGKRIAFVRIRGPGAPEIWVYDLAAQVATRIPGVPGGVDLSPSWAPDSVHLVIARAQDEGDRPLDSARRWGGYRTTSGDPELVILDASDPTAPAVEFDFCNDGCGASGRTPAWSPDGTRIAYEEDGQLELITVPDPCCTSQVIDGDGPVAITGDDFFPFDGPTPSRPVISAAHDPAWSPDGSEIAFAGQPVGQPDQSGIWGIGPDGSGLRLITDERGPETEPVYQPVRTADVAVAVSVADSPALVGDPVVASFTVTNNGPISATQVSAGHGVHGRRLARRRRGHPRLPPRRVGLPLRPAGRGREPDVHGPGPPPGAGPRHGHRHCRGRRPGSAGQQQHGECSVPVPGAGPPGARRARRGGGVRRRSPARHGLGAQHRGRPGRRRGADGDVVGPVAAERRATAAVR